MQILYHDKHQCGMVLMIVMMILLVLNLFAAAMLEMVNMEAKMTAEFVKNFGCAYNHTL